MCGICGVVAFGPSADPVDVPTLHHMTTVMSHRGPDSDGFCVSTDQRVGLGFRRLSIVDLATGDQPMSNEDDSIWLVFNGEIYNHADHRPVLESRGHRFRSRCDAEVILHLYEEYGAECVHQLRGMFAFAIWDSRRRVLLIARDRIGVKPVYYVANGSTFAFGSEIKALLAHPAFQPVLDDQALSLYLTFAAVPAPRTLFAGVRKLPAGHRLILNVDTGEQTLERYWQPLPDPVERATRRQPEEYVERLEELVRESIRLRMMSDVPYGAFLSGGVDSSLNVALMAELADRPVSTFSVAIEGDAASDEFLFARAVAERYGTRHHEIVIRDQDFIDYLPRLVWHQDEPLADPVCVPLHAISESARQSGTRVVQVGEGSDELFAGYTSYAFFVDFHRRVWRRYRAVPGPLRRAVAGTAGAWLRDDRADVLDRAADDGELYWGGAIAFFDRHKAALCGGLSHDARRMVEKWYAEVDRGVPDATQLDRMIGIELRQRLPELLLMRVDKVSMGSSIEARVPYLDHKLVEFALAIPGEIKYRDGTTKWVLKRVAERAGLDPRLVYRKKRGFCGSATNMLSPRLLAAAELAILESPLARDRFQMGFLKRMFAEQRAHRADHNFRLWNLWNLVAWHACWFEGPHPASANQQSAKLRIAASRRAD